MLIGVLISAVTGGLAGMALSVAQGHGLVRLLVSYPLGGILAVIAFILRTTLHAKARQAHFFQPDWF